MRRDLERWADLTLVAIDRCARTARDWLRNRQIGERYLEVTSNYPMMPFRDYVEIFEVVAATRFLGRSISTKSTLLFNRTYFGPAECRRIRKLRGNDLDAFLLSERL